MARRPKSTSREEPVQLVVSKDEAFNRIQTQMDKGFELTQKTIKTRAELEQLRRDGTKWRAYNAELLSRLFTGDSIQKQYVNTTSGFAFDVLGGQAPTLREEVDSEKEYITHDLMVLESIQERLELIPEHLPQVSTEKESTKEFTGPSGAGRVFIVHGRNNEAKETVARYISKIGLDPVILHEQPNRGSTVIEKLETYAKEASFAVVLMTPDDVVHPVDNKDEEKPRARQNVILELGYFLAHLKRDRVCALYVPGVEIPSDYSGVLFIEMDSYGAWRTSLIRELKTAGFNVDLEKALFS